MGSQWVLPAKRRPSEEQMVEGEAVRDPVTLESAHLDFDPGSRRDG